MKEIQEYQQRLSVLEQQRNLWTSHWQDIYDFILPQRGFFSVSGQLPNQGEKRHSKIIDGTATRAMRILVAGMQGGLTSPSRPWFRLTLSDPGLVEFGPVRWWLDQVERIIYFSFTKSNFYSSIMDIYNELAGYGTACLYEEERVDPGNSRVVWFKTFTVGEYSMATGPHGKVDTLYRRFWMTARNCDEQFKDGNLSDSVKQAAEKTPFEFVQVVHCIQPRKNASQEKADRTAKPFESVYFEYGRDEELWNGGYEECPFMAPRWATSGGDVYGRSPGMDVLGDVKMLQEMQKSMLKAVHKSVDPPMRVPSGYKDTLNLLPGGINYIDVMSPDSVGPLYNINLDMVSANNKITQIQTAIREGLFNDLFLMLLEKPGMTATEVIERHEEKLMMLGPVIEGLFTELLDPVIDRTFNILMRNGYVPPPPKEIMGQEIKVEYVSLLSQAQKMVGTQAVNATASFVGNLAQFNPDVLDKFDFDQAVDEYAGMVGAPASIIRSDDQVAQIRAQRAQQQQQAAMAQAMTQGVDIAKKLSELPPGGGSGEENALTQMAGGMGQ